MLPEVETKTLTQNVSVQRRTQAAPAERRLPASVRRLLVLVPETLVEEAELARQVWVLASARRLPVVFVGRAGSPAREDRMRWRLASLAALTRDDHVRVTTHITSSDWGTTLRTLREPGDAIVCHAEQTGRQRMRRGPLSDQLARALREPIHVLEGLCAPSEPRALNVGRRMVFWTGVAALVLVFFAIQAALEGLPQDWLQLTLLALTVLGEFALVAVWNRLFD